MPTAGTSTRAIEAQARLAAEYGVRIGPVSVDLAAVRERERAMVAGARQNYASLLAQDGRLNDHGFIEATSIWKPVFRC
jgi:hypothetical protein